MVNLSAREQKINDMRVEFYGNTNLGHLYKSDKKLIMGLTCFSLQNAFLYISIRLLF